jgi:hypothetical protein
MSLTVTTRRRVSALTTAAAVRRQVAGAASTGHDALLADLIAEASAAVESHCQRVFAREAITETFMGEDDLFIALARRPVVSLTSLLLDGLAVSGPTVEDADAGIITLAETFQKTEFSRSFLGPIFGQGGRYDERAYSAAYVSGFLLPEDDVASAAFTAASSDGSFNDPGADFPLLVPGDRVVASGFASSGNNRAFGVTSRTTSKIVVDAAVITETTSTGLKTLAVRNLPRDVERATIEAVKDWFLTRNQAPTVTAKRVENLAITYARPNAPGGAVAASLLELPSLPFTSLGLLARWVA